jgi:CRP-like cAMP-binding protein
LDSEIEQEKQAIDWSHPDIAKVFEQSKHRKYKKGDILLKPTDKTDYVHTILSGLVKVYTVDSQGNETLGVIYGRGDMFPLGWVIQQRHQSAYFQAITACEIALISRNIFVAQLKSSPHFSYAITQKLLEQLYVYAARANNLGLRYARERLAYRLLVFAARFGKREGGSIVAPHITQQDIAAAINVSRENVNRELIRLEKMGIISYSRSAIIIRDPAALRKELGKGVQVMFFDPPGAETPTLE